MARYVCVKCGKTPYCVKGFDITIMKCLACKWVFKCHNPLHAIEQLVKQNKIRRKSGSN